MKTSLKRDVKPIVEEEYNKLIGKHKPISISDWALNVAYRLKEELDLNSYAQEIAAAECQLSAHAKTGDFPLVEEVLLPGFNDDELKSKGFRFGKDRFVTLYDANIEQITDRFMHQFDHAQATMESAARTKAIMDSEIGKLMAQEPTLSFGKAKKLWLKEM